MTHPVNLKITHASAFPAIRTAARAEVPDTPANEHSREHAADQQEPTTRFGHQEGHGKVLDLRAGTGIHPRGCGEGAVERGGVFPGNEILRGRWAVDEIDGLPGML